VYKEKNGIEIREGKTGGGGLGEQEDGPRVDRTAAEVVFFKGEKELIISPYKPKQLNNFDKNNNNNFVSQNMQCDKCMMIHKNKRTNKSKKGIFLGRYTKAKGTH
jgi:hypothetical protein